MTAKPRFALVGTGVMGSLHARVIAEGVELIAFEAAS